MEKPLRRAGWSGLLHVASEWRAELHARRRDVQLTQGRVDATITGLYDRYEPQQLLALLD
jgi:hypothetical protein